MIHWMELGAATPLAPTGIVWMVAYLRLRGSLLG